MANFLSLGMKLMSLTVLYLLLNFGFVEAENPLFLIGKPISNLLRLNRVGSDAAQQISSAAFSLQNIKIQSSSDVYVSAQDIERGLQELSDGFKNAQLSHAIDPKTKKTLLMMEKMTIQESANFQRAMREVSKLMNDGPSFPLSLWESRREEAMMLFDTAPLACTFSLSSWRCVVRSVSPARKEPSIRAG
jgi:hypothetical protein